MWYRRRMEKIKWNYRVRNEVLQRVEEESNIVQTIKKEGRPTGLVTLCVGTTL